MSVHNDFEVKNTVLNADQHPLSAYDDVSMTNLGQSTYYFVRRLMCNPEYRAKIQAKAAELKAAGIC